MLAGLLYCLLVYCMFCLLILMFAYVFESLLVSVISFGTHTHTHTCSRKHAQTALTPTKEGGMGRERSGWLDPGGGGGGWVKKPKLFGL
jgi:hypothetical protein